MKITKLEMFLLFSLAFPIIGFFALSGSFWFTATATVLDFVRGENPVVNYEREISKKFVGYWDVQLRRTDVKVNQQYCTGHGQNIYLPSANKRFPLSLTDYAGVSVCAPPPGYYVMDTCWRWRVFFLWKEFCTASNEFKVLAK